MRNRSPLSLVLPLLLVCFAAGVLSVILKPPTNDPSPAGAAPTLPSNPEIPPETQSVSTRSTILIMGVDSLAEPQAAQLEALWLLTFGTSDERIELLGIAHDVLLPDGRNLRQAFSIFDPPDFGANFIRALGDYSAAPIMGWVVLDQAGFARLIDYLGGFTLGDQAYDGSRTIGALNLLLNRPQESLKLQARVLQALIERAPDLGRTPEVTSLTTLVPDHAITSPSAPQLAAMAIPLLPLDPSRVDLILLPQLTE